MCVLETLPSGVSHKYGKFLKIFSLIFFFQEVDRRHEISNGEALEADHERNRARAEKLLSAFDDSDDDS